MPTDNRRTGRLAAVHLATADSLINGDRHDTYGDALHDFRRIGEVWSALLDLPLPLPPHTVAAMLTAMKLIRTQITPTHLDSWQDAAAYAALGAAIVQQTTSVTHNPH